MAKIYDQDISKGISLNEAQVSNLNLGISNICGYLPKAALDRLLSLPECVGIRFYNVKKKIIQVVGVSIPWWQVL